MSHFLNFPYRALNVPCAAWYSDEGIREIDEKAEIVEQTIMSRLSSIADPQRVVGLVFPESCSLVLQACTLGRLTMPHLVGQCLHCWLPPRGATLLITDSTLLQCDRRFLHDFREEAETWLAASVLAYRALGKTLTFDINRRLHNVLNNQHWCLTEVESVRNLLSAPVDDDTKLRQLTQWLEKGHASV